MCLGVDVATLVSLNAEQLQSPSKRMWPEQKELIATSLTGRSLEFQQHRKAI